MSALEAVFTHVQLSLSLISTNGFFTSKANTRNNFSLRKCPALKENQPKLNAGTSVHGGQLNKEKPASYPAPSGAVLLDGALPRPEF